MTGKQRVRVRNIIIPHEAIVARGKLIYRPGSRSRSRVCEGGDGPVWSTTYLRTGAAVAAANYIQGENPC